jgi:hypothetical protein
VWDHPSLKCLNCLARNTVAAAQDEDQARQLRHCWRLPSGRAARQFVQQHRELQAELCECCAAVQEARALAAGPELDAAVAQVELQQLRARQLMDAGKPLV